MANPDSHYTPTSDVHNRGIPDLRFINKQIPILDIARALDLRVSENGNIHCWRSDHHHNGDRTASVGIRKVNNTVKCFGCGIGPLGAVDLVMSVLEMANPADAARWISERFDVPPIERRKHVVHPPRHLFRYGFEDDIEFLIYSGLWAKLSSAARSIIPVLYKMAERDESTGVLKICMSYRAISRYAGIASRTVIRKAILELQEINWLTIVSTSRLTNDPIRDTSTYLLTPRSDELVEASNYECARMKSEIETEKKIRKEQREERRRSITKYRTSVTKHDRGLI